MGQWLNEAEDESAIEPADDPPITASVAVSHLLALDKFYNSEGMEAEANVVERLIPQAVCMAQDRRI